MREGTVDLDKINSWISGLLREKGQDIYRSKGVISIQVRGGEAMGSVVHGWEEAGETGDRREIRTPEQICIDRHRRTGTDARKRKPTGLVARVVR